MALVFWDAEDILFEVQHPRCVSRNHKIKQQTLESQNTTILYYIILYYIVLYI